MLDRPVRCAVIGAGLLGSDHAEFLAKNDNAQLLAIADIRFDAAEDVTRSTGGKPYADYEEMLREQSLDLVVIATPDAVHKDPAVACCEAGVPNLVIQKPLSTTVEDGLAIVEAARAAGTRVFMWYINRAWGLNMATCYAIRSGLIGKVVYGDCATDDSISVPLTMWGQRSEQWVTGSSPVHFLSTHTLDRLLWYFSPAKVERVFAMHQHEILGYTPDLVDAFLYFDNGLKVRMKSGWIHHIERGVELVELFNGDAGQVISARFDRFNCASGWRLNLAEGADLDELRHHQAVLKKRGIGSRIVLRDPLESGWQRGILTGLEIQASQATNRELLEFVLDAIIEDTTEPTSWRKWQGSGPLPMGDVALENLRVIRAIEESAREGAIVDV